MILTIGKRFGMVNVVMDKTTHIQFIAAAEAVCINKAVRHDFLLNNSLRPLQNSPFHPTAGTQTQVFGCFRPKLLLILLKYSLNPPRTT